MRRGVLSFSLMIAAVAAASLVSTPSRAYTADQQQLCTDDAFRLCSSAIPDVDRVTACMIQRRAQLSPGCAQFFRDPEPEAVPTPVRARKPTSVKPRKANPKTKRPRG